MLRRQRRAEPDPVRNRDLDETRRVAYILLASSKATRPGAASAVGTLVNALAHHSKAADPDEVMRHALALLDEEDPGHEEARSWVLAQISDLTSKLDEL